MSVINYRLRCTWSVGGERGRCRGIAGRAEPKATPGDRSGLRFGVRSAGVLVQLRGFHRVAGRPGVIRLAVKETAATLPGVQDRVAGREPAVPVAVVSRPRSEVILVSSRVRCPPRGCHRVRDAPSWPVVTANRAA